jgi:hypothetical protein
MQVTVNKKIEAVQYLEANGIDVLQDTLKRYGTWHACQVEVEESADGKLIYYSYGSYMKSRAEHWMGTTKLSEEPKRDGSIFGGSWVGFTPKDGSAPYYREWLPFAFWSVKSKSSMLRYQGKPDPTVYLDTKDKDAVAQFHDYASASKWPNPIHQCAEFRIVDGAYGRGFKPLYVYDTDWLIIEPYIKPNGGYDEEHGRNWTARVLTDAQMTELRAA